MITKPAPTRQAPAWQHELRESFTRPQDLLDDPHLNANGAFVDLTLTNGKHVKLPALPVEIDGRLPGVRHDLAQVGEDTEAVLRGWGFSDAEVAGLVAKGAVEAFGHAAGPAP